MQEVILVKPTTLFDHDLGDFVNEEEVLTGVVAFQAGNQACDIHFYDNTAIIVPFSRIIRIKRRALTDEEILNGEDKGFAKWYKERQEAAKEAADEAAKKQKAANEIQDGEG